jgi:type IV pilus assembly protein PilE
MKRNTNSGFTLIELMVVVAILGIIVAIGYPAYTDQVRKSRRAEGMGELLEMADKMERHYSDQNTYDQTLGGLDMTAAALLGSSTTTTTNGYYTLAVVGTTSNVAFTLSATPTTKGGQNKDKCGTFRIDWQGNKTLDTTNGGARSATGYGNEDCWR